MSEQSFKKTKPAMITPEEFQHNVLVVNINKSVKELYPNQNLTEDEIYECAKRAWHINIKKAEKVEYVIAKHENILKGIFKPEKWCLDKDEPERYCFEGVNVDSPEIKDLYLDKELDYKSHGPFNYFPLKK